MKAPLSRKTDLARRIIQTGQYGEFTHILRRKLWSTERSWGLSRDLTAPFAAPDAKTSVIVRLIEPDDVRALLNVGEEGLTREDRWDRVVRLHLLDAGFSRCYVAATADDRACYIQWLIAPEENALLQSTFDGHFPRLQENEVLLEGAYTVAEFRGQGIMPAAMARIAERGAELGTNRAITFVGDDNIPSLKGCKRAGFYPSLERLVTHRLGRRSTVFSPLPAGTPYSFDRDQVTVYG
jgi:RimJ/RimL family protein N-acetyltransferase